MRLKLSCFLFAAGSLSAQQQPDLRQVVERLDRLEAQNRELMTEILALRQQLAAVFTHGQVVGQQVEPAPVVAAGPHGPGGGRDQHGDQPGPGAGEHCPDQLGRGRPVDGR